MAASIERIPPSKASWRTARFTGSGGYKAHFRNDFDLHRFPFDRQTLSIPFFNARAAADCIVYVLDNRSALAQQDSSGPTPALKTHWGSAAAAESAAKARYRNCFPGRRRSIPQFDAGIRSGRANGGRTWLRNPRSAIPVVSTRKYRV